MKSRKYFSLLFAAIILIQGCGTGPEGSEQAARAYLAGEFDKWMSGQDNEAATFKARLQSQVNPISYEIRSVVPDKPDPLAIAKPANLTKDWKEWPAYRLNVVYGSISRAGTPLEQVATYTLTWNAFEKKWYVKDRS
ncbi:hypothetical protein [Gimesia sp.]|uniref:hypothetical protein n=1 Tax=Gimesia sp. TaxID=2024833 RepID=UPI0032EE3A1D